MLHGIIAVVEHNGVLKIGGKKEKKLKATEKKKREMRTGNLFGAKRKKRNRKRKRNPSSERSRYNHTVRTGSHIFAASCSNNKILLPSTNGAGS